MIPHTHSFEYGGNNGELTKVTFPYGGDLRWAYRSYNYFGGQMLREVQYRYLSKAVGAALNTYTFAREDSGGAYHSWAVVQNPGGTGEKAWYFNSGGLNTAYEDRPAPGQPAARRKDFTWTQDAAGTPYIGAALTTLDPGTAWQAQSKTEQSLDTHGNVVWTKVYDYGNLSTPARTYNHIYVTNANYTSRFMFNRVVTSTLTPAGGGTITLVNNLYDHHCDGNPFYGPYDALLWDTTYLGLIYRGNLAFQTTPTGTTCRVRDYTGTVRRHYDGAGHVTTFDTNSTTRYAVPAAIAGGGVTNNFTYTAFLGIASVTETNGSAALFSYDGNARPTETTSPHGAKTTYTYTTSPPTATATTNGRFVKTTYDGLGRTIKVERGDGAPNNMVTRSVVDTEYDVCACSPLGKVKRVSQPYAPGAPVYWTTYNYDGLGRLLSVVAPDGASTGTYLYQGRATTVTDPAGKWKKFTTDAMGNLVQVTEPNPAGGANFETYYTYDALNNLTRVEMPRGGYTQTRTFAYQGKLLTSATNPESGTTTYTYYGDGNLATRTDARNRRLEYTYDGYGRLTVERAMSFQSNQWVETGRKEYQWDSNNIDPYVSQYASGRLAAVVERDGATETSYVYGYTRGGLIQTKQMRTSYGPEMYQPFISNWTYDDEGKTTSIESPLAVYTYGYDSMGRQNRLSRDSTVLVSGASYNAAGQLTSVDYLVQQPYTYYSQTREYNESLQLTRITGSGSVLPGVNLEYRYPAGQNNGRISQSKDWVSGEEVSYTYDSLNRLVAAVTTGPEWGTSYTYDGWGNLTAKTVTKGTAPAWSNAVDPATNRLVGWGYDAAGNQGDPALYDGWNRVAPPGYWGPLYGYDVYNKRVFRNTPSPGQIFLYGIDGRKMETIQLSASGGIVGYKDDVYFAGQLIISEDRWVITDRLGSVRGDGGGQRYNYYPYGEERGSTANGVTKFGTYFRDDATLDYADQRYYANNQGRFLTPDPYRASAGAADPGSWNRYAYVQGDPVNANDPTGLKLNFLVCGAAGDPYGGVDGCGGGGGGHFSAFPTSIRDAEGTPIGGTLTKVWFPGIYDGEPPSASSADRLFGDSFERISTKMTQPCAKAIGASGVEDARRALGNTNYEFVDLGGVSFSDGVSTGGPMAHTHVEQNVVEFNSSVNWADPSHQAAVINGASGTVNLLSNSAFALGITSMTPEQLMDLTLLHELSHLFGGLHGTDVAAYDKAIWKDCFK